LISFVSNVIEIHMTTFHSSTTIQNKSCNSIKTSPSFSPHLIEVSVTDLESELVPKKGLYAVLPAYNEELVIGSVVLRTKQYVNHVIVVDDGSSDRTAEVAKLAGAEVIQLEHNTGKAYAILLGLRRARELGCTVAVMLDADGQHDPREIQRVAGLVSSGKSDLVIGSRFLEKNSVIPPYRQIGQKILDLFTNMGAKSKVTDSQSGFRALSCQAMDNLDFRSDRYNIESDMIAHFSALGLSIMEVPISVNYEVPNKHKKHPLTHGVSVLTRLINLIGYRRPLLLFGVLGTFLVIVGLSTVFYAFREYTTTSTFPFAISMVSMLLLNMGMLMIIAGLLLNTLLMMMKDRQR
jgi:glycosyltransferase involved in cell wall biosynthesis